VADETMGTETVEMAEAVPVDMSQPMQITDASFADEQAVQTLLADYVDNPKQTTAAILNILLGDFGVGHFYTGQTLRGVLDIIFCWTGIPAIIGIVEGIIWLTDTEEEWAARVAGWRNK
jgi:TM2 domain-containing membrane protein YozV